MEKGRDYLSYSDSIIYIQTNLKEFIHDGNAIIWANHQIEIILGTFIRRHEFQDYIFFEISYLDKFIDKALEPFRVDKALDEIYQMTDDEPLN